MAVRLIPFFILAYLNFYATDSFTGYPAEDLTSGVFKILPILWLAIIVKFTTDKTEDDRCENQKKFTALGLAISIPGDVFLVWRKTGFLPGLLVFSVAQSCYLKALTFSPKNYLSGVICAIAGYSLMGHVLSVVDEGYVMQFCTFVYSCLILTMTWRALAQALTDPSAATWVCVLGTVGFICSDFMLALDRWQPIAMLGDRTQFYVMLTYYGAQLGLACGAMWRAPRPDAIRLRKSD